MSDVAVGARRGLFVPAISAAIAFAVLVGLGVWQLQRLSWKEGLIATLHQRLSQPPVPLPPSGDWPRLSARADEYRRVTFKAMVPTNDEALVYTSGSALRPDAKGVGDWVFVPAHLPGGGTVVVNRGFVPEERKDPATRAVSLFTGVIEITGALRWPEEPGLFTPAGEPGKNLWYARDQRPIAVAKKWGEVAPFYIEQESPPAPGGLPKVGKVVPTLPNSHLQYAITWFGLALVLLGVFAAYALGRWREA